MAPPDPGDDGPPRPAWSAFPAENARPIEAIRWLRVHTGSDSPLVRVDLDGIEDASYAALDEVMQALANDHRVQVGMRSRPLPSGYTGPAWWIVNAMSTTIVPMPTEAPRTHRQTPMEQTAGLVESDDPARTVARIEATVRAQPVAALVLDGLLRQNVDLSVIEGLRNERLAEPVTSSLLTLPGHATTPGGGRVRIAFRDGPTARAAAYGPPVPPPDPSGVEESLPALLHHHRDQILVTLEGSIHGPAIELVAFSDDITAAPGTRISWPDLAVGRIPASGGTVSLTRRIGRWRTAALILAGLEIDAVTAYRWGLIDRISGD